MKVELSGGGSVRARATALMVTVATSDFTRLGVDSEVVYLFNPSR